MYTKRLNKVNFEGIKEVGGKGISLVEMIKIKFPIPQGFVILSSAFDKFLEENGLNLEVKVLLHKVNLEDINLVDRVSNEIRDLFLNSEFPKDIAKEILKEFSKLKTRYVAVRSSATVEDSSVASWAGELESYLNTTKSNLLENVKKSWASLFTPRAIFYRLEKKLKETRVSMAVVVQKMIQSEISGICFTVHPVTKDYNQMVIEAGYGLGEAIVEGKITPDTYTIHKKKLEIIDNNVRKQKMMIVKDKDGNTEKGVPKSKQEKQKLLDFQILKLAKICRKIEVHYKKPQDIEWAFEKRKFYIIQSRPITTL